MVGLSHPAQARGGRLEVGEGAETEGPRGLAMELDRGEWRLRHWARELGVSEDEMLIELDRHLHHHRAA